MGEKSTIRKIVIYAIALIFIFYNYTSQFLFLGKIAKEDVMMIPLAIGFLLFFYIIIRESPIDKGAFTMALLLLCNILLSSLLNNSIQSEVYMLMGSIFVALVTVSLLSREEFIDCYVNLMVFLAIYSLVATYWFLPMQMNGIIDIFPRVHIDDRVFYDMYLAQGWTTWGIPRNCGFCREAGVYQIFLLIALYFTIEHCSNQKWNVFRIIILMVTLVSTFSAVAYVTAIITIFLLIKKNTVNVQRFGKSFLLSGLLVLGLFLIIQGNEDIKEELLRTFSKWEYDDTQATGSLQVRVSGIFANLELFIEKPLLGNGLVKSWLEIIDRYGFVDVTGTTLIGFAAFGLPFGIIIHYLLWKMCRTHTLVSSWMWFIIILFALLSQNLIISNLFWILLFFPFTRKKQDVLWYQNETVRTLS